MDPRDLLGKLLYQYEGGLYMVEGTLSGSYGVLTSLKIEAHRSGLSVRYTTNEHWSASYYDRSDPHDYRKQLKQFRRETGTPMVHPRGRLDFYVAERFDVVIKSDLELARFQAFLVEMYAKSYRFRYVSEKPNRNVPSIIETRIQVTRNNPRF